jgi:VWFA-related protein
LDFTTDRQMLLTTVAKMRWGQVAGRGGMQCPDVSYYIAHLIVDFADSQALEALTGHTSECAHVRPEMARQIALAAANREMLIGPQDTLVALSSLKRAIRRLSGMPGQRVIVLASPGFFAQSPEAIQATTEVLESAAKNEVIISGLSARGLILADEEEDVARKTNVSRRTSPGAAAPDQAWIRYRRESARADGDVMNDLAEGTGGVFFHNNNDLRSGFTRVAAAPDYSYVLGFSPAGLKADGSFHSLKIRLRNQNGENVEARRGYYAPRPGSRSGESSAEELEDAIFSRDEQHDIPVILQTGYSKPNNADVVTVLLTAKIEAGRSSGSFDVATSIFDEEGGYVVGTAEKVSFQEPVFTLHWELPGISPAGYMVRLVVHDFKNRKLTAINRTLQVR